MIQAAFQERSTSVALVMVTTEDGDMVLSLQVSADGVPPETAADDAMGDIRAAVLEALASEEGSDA
jgi:hypothetical protein